MVLKYYKHLQLYMKDYVTKNIKNIIYFIYIYVYTHMYVCTVHVVHFTDDQLTSSHHSKLIEIYTHMKLHIYMHTASHVVHIYTCTLYCNILYTVCYSGVFYYILYGGHHMTRTNVLHV